MRRYATILIAFSLLLSVVTACAEKEREIYLTDNEAFTKYVNAVNAIRSADSFAGFLIVSGRFSMMDLDRENDIVVGIKHIFGEGDNFQAEIDASWTDANFFTYYRNGVYYLDAPEDYYKQAFPGEEFLKMTLSKLVTDVLFNEEDIFGLDAVEDSNGTAMRFEVRQAGMQDLLRQLADFEDTGGLTVYGHDDVSYEFEDVVIRMRIDNDGALRDIRLAFVYMATHHHIADGVEFSAYLEIGMNVAQIGGVTIDFPDDLDSFPDILEEYRQWELERGSGAG